MNSRASRVIGAAITTALAAAVAGCAGATQEPSPSASPATAAAASTAIAASPSAIPTPLASPDPSSDVASAWQDESDPEARLAGCLAGTWELDREVWVAGMQAVMAADLDSVDIEDSGQIALAIDPAGEYTVAAEDSLTISTGTSQGGTLRWSLLFDGVEPGTWTVAGDQLSLSVGAGERIEAVHEVSIDGEPLPADSLATDGSPWSETLAVTCDVDTFTAIPVDEPEGVEIAFNRTP